MQSVPLLQLFPGPLWLEVVVPYRVQFIEQIEVLDHLTVCKQMADIWLYGQY